jgi:hypothetical protein
MTYLGLVWTHDGTTGRMLEHQQREFTLKTLLASIIRDSFGV